MLTPYKRAANLVLAFILLLTSGMPAAAETKFDVLLKKYEQSANIGPNAISGGTTNATGTPTNATGRQQPAATAQHIAAANALFAFLDEAKFTDQPIRFSPGTRADSVGMMADYWAAEYLFNEQQQADRAIALATRALPRCLASRDPLIGPDCLALLAICHFRKGEWKEAANYAKKLYELDKRSGDADRMSSSLNTLAAIFMGAKQPREAEKYIKRAIETSQQTDNRERQAVILGMAAEVYHSMNDEQQSLAYARQAYEMEQQLGRKGKAAIRLSQMAAAYIATGQAKEAKDALTKAIPQLRADGNSHSLGICLNQLGDLLLKEGKKADAARNYQEALALHIAQGDLYNESHARKGLYDALKDTDPKLAMTHIERYNELKDSLYDRETGELLSKFNAQYGNEQLQEANEQQQRQKRNIATAALLVTGVLIIIICVLWHASRRRQQKSLIANDQLRRQHNQLKKKYANILATNRTNTGELADKDRQLIDYVIKFTHNHMEEGKADLDTLAEELCMSVSTLRRRLTSITGEAPAYYLMKLRLEEARHLMDTHRDMPISDVAQKCGFDDKSNFARTFRRVFGVSPSEYMRGEQKQ